jgi:hypothetical protein
MGEPIHRNKSPTVAQSRGSYSMRNSRLGLKLLGLCALVLGVMSLGASAAQASGTWNYINAKAELKELPEETIGGTLENNHSVLHTKIAGVSVLFLCTEFTVKEGKLKPGGTVLGSLVFHGCRTELNGVVSAACLPVAKKVNKDLIETLTAKGLQALHNGEPIVIFEPDTGSNAFAHVELGEECSIGEDVLIGGKFAIKDCLGKYKEHRVNHLIEEFPALTELWAISNTPEHKATILGSAEVFLTGANKGLKWAGLPL